MKLLSHRKTIRALVFVRRIIDNTERGVKKIVVIIKYECTEHSSFCSQFKNCRFREFEEKKNSNVLELHACNGCL